jgi:S-adenosylmethionine hydrolase
MGYRHVVGDWPLVFLLTDFGTYDPYVAQMKAALLSRAPGVNIVDYTHHVRAFDIVQAGFFLWSGYAHFPLGSVIVAVVDPGVGTSRRIVLVEYEKRLVIAPDNGLTSLLLPQDGSGVRAFAAHVDGKSSSRTFHGRDVFAPLAARVINGEDLAILGEEISPRSLKRLSWSHCGQQGNRIRTHVLHVDGFGNCLLNLPIDQWEGILRQVRTFKIYPWGTQVVPAATYHDLQPGQPGLVAGSQGVYELCLREGSVALQWKVKPGDRVELEMVL